MSMKSTISIVTILFLVVLICGIINTQQNMKYELECQIIDITEQEIHLIDPNDNIWIWERDNENFNIGDDVCLVMNNNCTISIYDDEIISLRPHS